MKKITKKSASKASKKAVKDLDIKPAKGGSVRGGSLYGGGKKDKTTPTF